MRKGIFVGMAALLVVSAFAQAGTIAAPAGATPIFSDDFEGYADDAALKATWNLFPAPTSAGLAAGGGKGGGNGVVSSGGVTPIGYTLPTLTLTSGMDPIVVEVDCWDYAGASRDSIDIRGGSTYFDMGIYNAMDDGSGGAVGNGYGARDTGAGAPAGTKGGWWSLNPTRVTSTDPALAYHHYKMVISDVDAVFTLTMAGGATYSKTITHTALAVGKTLTQLRLGTGVSSVGTVIYDNVQVYSVPEPASMLLLGLGGLLLRRRQA